MSPLRVGLPLVRQRVNTPSSGYLLGRAQVGNDLPVGSASAAARMRGNKLCTILPLLAHRGDDEDRTGPFGSRTERKAHGQHSAQAQSAVADVVAKCCGPGADRCPAGNNGNDRRDVATHSHHEIGAAARSDAFPWSIHLVKACFTGPEPNSGRNPRPRHGAPSPRRMSASTAPMSAC